LVAFSKDTNRAVGVLVDRRGHIVSLIVGDTRRLYLPDIGRARGGGARFRGLRLLRTHLAGDPLGHDDLTDLSKLQLDLVLSVTVSPAGTPAGATWAHLVPDNPDGELWKIHAERNVAATLFPFEDFIRELEAEFEQKVDRLQATDEDRAMIVYVRTRADYNHVAALAELHELCRTASVEVAEAYVQSRHSLDPKTAVGSGALEEIELRSLQLGATILVFGQDLTPAQSRAIGERTQLRVVDRTQLILDIFAQRAQSRVGKLQVELAQLKYRLPRLSGRGTAMSRLAGGIGGRGPGETKLEIDRRRARDRIRQLEGSIERIGAQRELRRKNRRQSGAPVIAIVGYTNAGKSTLLNTLTHSNVLSEDKLFATLDPTTRRLRFPEEREVILTDTVGFIQDLPQELREAFRATLEELHEADLLLHVLDASDPAVGEQARSTERILEELDLGEIPRLCVYNKIDLLDAESLEDLQLGSDAVFVSALARDSTRQLIDTLERWLIEHGHAGRVLPSPGREEATSDSGDDAVDDAIDDAIDDTRGDVRLSRANDAVDVNEETI